MTDVVERLNEAMFDIKDKTRINPDLWNPLALAICDATDEIHGLRAALREISSMPTSEEDGVNKALLILSRSKARAALGEKE